MTLLHPISAIGRARWLHKKNPAFGTHPVRIHTCQNLRKYHYMERVQSSVMFSETEHVLLYGAGCEIRTHDLRLTKPLHYRCAKPALVEPTGIKPVRRATIFW